MTKISFVLAFALVLALPFRSVLGQEDSWQSIINQASQAGLSQETIDEAEKALGDGSAQNVAEEVMGDAGNTGSLGDWVQKANDMGINKGSPPTEYSPAEAPEDLPEDELEDSPAEAPEKSPTKAPEEAPTSAPVEAPELAPKNAPAKAPELAPKNAPTEAPEWAPTNAPKEAPEWAPTNAPTEEPSAAPQAQAPSAATPQAA